MTKNLYSQYIFKSRYARYLDDKKRREEWQETITRYLDFMKSHLLKHFKYELSSKDYTKLYNAIYEFEVMPSMRAMMTAGKALERDNVAGFNCTYATIDDVKAFDEIMFILMCGSGVGFSVERQYINQLPEIPDKLYPSDTKIIVKDSKEGWAKAFRQLLALLYSGEIPKWDLSLLRPAGTRLKTFGGRSSGPVPLDDLFKFTVRIFLNAQGRKLTSLECHDIACKIGETVVVGGVRRCCKKDTPIQTINGYKKIQDITIGDIIVTGGKSYPVTGYEYSGKQNIIKIKHQFGEINVTQNHQVAVFDTFSEQYSFKLAGDLLKGDLLVWDGSGIDGNITKLPQFKYNEHFNAKKIIFNDSVNCDVAWLIGLIHGDGHVAEKTIEISINYNDEHILVKANKIFFSIFGVSGKISDGNGCLRLRINSKAIANWFKENIKISNQNISIPPFIFGSSKNIRESYLAGLFDADGRITNDNGIDQVTTIYEGFKDELITLLSSLGIGHKVYYGDASNRRLNGVDAKNYYTIRIVGKINKEKWNNVANYSLSNKISKMKIDFSTKNDFAWVKSIHNKSQWKFNMSFSTSVEKGYIKNMGYYPSIITDIIDDNVHDTYDIEVADIHQFTTNGIVVHNSAMISLSNLSDDRMRNAKSGAWWEANPQRTLSNNSAVYTEKPEIGTFMHEWLSLYESKSGERGIFNREASIKIAERNGRRDVDYEFGSNPCCEIILRPNEMCNLTEVVVRSSDDENKLLQKIEIATILGTIQSTLTHFPYLRKIWKKNCDEERLLGVSLTGIYDSPRLNNWTDSYLPTLLTMLKEKAIATNEEWANKLGIPQSAAITCIKPSGTVSQLVDAASGIHPRHANYYIRRVRSDNKDPLTQYLIDAGVPYEPDVIRPGNTTVFSFPMKAPDGAITRDDISSLDHLKLWLLYQEYYCEHKPSVTISIKEDEWMKVGAWVYDNFDNISGISFLPYDGGTYRQAPYETINEEQYNELLNKMPVSIDWEKLIEEDDNVEGAQMLACSANGGCEL